MSDYSYNNEKMFSWITQRMMKNEQEVSDDANWVRYIDSEYGNDDGTLTKNEFSYFVKKEFSAEDLNSFKNLTGKNDSDKNDIINKFWAAIDTNRTLSYVQGTRLYEQNALNSSEVNKANQEIKKYEILTKFLDKQVKIAINELSDDIADFNRMMPGWSDTFKSKVTESLTNLMLEYHATPDGLEEYLAERFKTVKKFTIADMIGQHYVNQAKQQFKTELAKQGLNATDNELGFIFNKNSDIQGLITNYINTIKKNDAEAYKEELGDSWVTTSTNKDTLADIKENMQDIVAEYFNTAIPNAIEEIFATRTYYTLENLTAAGFNVDSNAPGTQNSADTDELAKYFVKMPNGTYVIDEYAVLADFPKEEYGEIHINEETTLLQLKAAINKKEKMNTNSQNRSAILDGNSNSILAQNNIINSGISNIAPELNGGYITDSSATIAPRSLQHRVAGETYESYLNRTGNNSGRIQQAFETGLQNNFQTNNDPDNAVARWTDFFEDEEETYTNDQLKNILSQSIINSYFKATADGKLTMNTELISSVFPKEQFGVINTQQDLANAVSKIKYTNEQLNSTLSQSLINSYFEKTDDGKYTMKTKLISSVFPKAQFGAINTPDDLANAINSIKGTTTTDSSYQLTRLGYPDKNTKAINNLQQYVLKKTLNNYLKTQLASNASNVDLLPYYEVCKNLYDQTVERFTENYNFSNIQISQYNAYRENIGSLESFGNFYSNSVDMQNLVANIRNIEVQVKAAVEEVLRSDETYNSIENGCAPIINYALGDEIAAYIKESAQNGDVKISEIKNSVIEELIAQGLQNMTDPFGTPGTVQIQQLQQIQQQTLQIQQNYSCFTDKDIFVFFDKNDDGTYSLKKSSLIWCFGSEIAASINTPDDLIDAFDTYGITEGYAKGAYEGQKTGKNGTLLDYLNKIDGRYFLDHQRISDEFGVGIQTYGELIDLINEQCTSCNITVSSEVAVQHKTANRARAINLNREIETREVEKADDGNGNNAIIDLNPDKTGNGATLPLNRVDSGDNGGGTVTPINEDGSEINPDKGKDKPTTIDIDDRLIRSLDGSTIEYNGYKYYSETWLTNYFGNSIDKSIWSKYLITLFDDLTEEYNLQDTYYYEVPDNFHFKKDFPLRKEVTTLEELRAALLEIYGNTGKTIEIVNKDPEPSSDMDLAENARNLILTKIMQNLTGIFNASGLPSGMSIKEMENTYKEMIDSSKTTGAKQAAKLFLDALFNNNYYNKNDLKTEINNMFKEYGSNYTNYIDALKEDSGLGTETTKGIMNRVFNCISKYYFENLATATISMDQNGTANLSASSSTTLGVSSPNIVDESGNSVSSSRITYVLLDSSGAAVNSISSNIGTISINGSSVKFKSEITRGTLTADLYVKVDNYVIKQSKKTITLSAATMNMAEDLKNTKISFDDTRYSYAAGANESVGSNSYRGVDYSKDSQSKSISTWISTPDYLDLSKAWGAGSSSERGFENAQKRAKEKIESILDTIETTLINCGKYDETIIKKAIKKTKNYYKNIIEAVTIRSIMDAIGAPESNTVNDITDRNIYGFTEAATLKGNVRVYADYNDTDAIQDAHNSIIDNSNALEAGGLCVWLGYKDQDSYGFLIDSSKLFAKVQEYYNNPAIKYYD